MSVTSAIAHSRAIAKNGEGCNTDWWGSFGNNRTSADESIPESFSTLQVHWQHHRSSSRPTAPLSYLPWRRLPVRTQASMSLTRQHKCVSHSLMSPIARKQYSQGVIFAINTAYWCSDHEVYTLSCCRLSTQWRSSMRSTQSVTCSRCTHWPTNGQWYLYLPTLSICAVFERVHILFVPTRLQIIYADYVLFHLR